MVVLLLHDLIFLRTWLIVPSTVLFIQISRFVINQCQFCFLRVNGNVKRQSNYLTGLRGRVSQTLVISFLYCLPKVSIKDKQKFFTSTYHQKRRNFYRTFCCSMIRKYSFCNGKLTLASIQCRNAKLKDIPASFLRTDIFRSFSKLFLSMTMLFHPGEEQSWADTLLKIFVLFACFFLKWSPTAVQHMKVLQNFTRYRKCKTEKKCFLKLILIIFYLSVKQG